MVFFLLLLFNSNDLVCYTNRSCEQMALCVCACVRACERKREREAVILIHPKPAVGYVQAIHGVCLPEYLFDYMSLCRKAV